MMFISRAGLLGPSVGTGAAAGAFAAACAFLFPSFATADPQNGDNAALVNTSCSADQIQTAVQHEAPKFWEHVSSDPDKADQFHDKLQGFLEKSPEDRQAAIDTFHANANEWAKEHPDKAKQAQQHKEQFRETLARVLDTCSEY